MVLPRSEQEGNMSDIVTDKPIFSISDRLVCDEIPDKFLKNKDLIEITGIL
jgi:hypothetical protein